MTIICLPFKQINYSYFILNRLLPLSYIKKQHATNFICMQPYRVALKLKEALFNLLIRPVGNCVIQAQKPAFPSQFQSFTMYNFTTIYLG